MPPKNMTPRTIYWPDDWLPIIDAERGEIEFSEYVREAVRKRIGKGKLPDPPKRGRPKKAQ